MGTQHEHATSANKKILIISFVIITTYMLIEAVGGILTNSLALLSDAGHMLSDAISLGISLLAIMLGVKQANKEKTFGYKRIEILAALLNGLTLIIIALYIFYEAMQRFANPPEIASIGMLSIAMVGLFINLLVAWIMMRGADTKGNLNMRSAYLHVISDVFGSIGAITAALLILFFEWGWADPVASVLVAILVLRSGVYVMKSTLHVLMEGTPHNIDVEILIKKMMQHPAILGVHDVHIWTITSGVNVLSCHVVVAGTTTIFESEQLVAKLEHDLAHENIQHVTIQIESPTHTHKDALYCTLKQGSSEHTHHHH